MDSWKTRTVEFDWLRRYANQFSNYGSVVEWLYVIGVVPNDVRRLSAPTIKTELNPKAIPAGYLAATAMEWDDMGRSTPNEFLDALECELSGSEKHGNVVDFLSGLGRLAAYELTVNE